MCCTLIKHSTAAFKNKLRHCACEQLTRLYYQERCSNDTHCTASDSFAFYAQTPRLKKCHSNPVSHDRANEAFWLIN